MLEDTRQEQEEVIVHDDHLDVRVNVYDPVVIDGIGPSEDPVAEVHRYLGVAARVVGTAAQTVEEVTVRARFEDMLGRFDTIMAQAKAEVGQFTDCEDGPLALFVAEERRRLEERMAQVFDPTSTTSAIGLFDTAFKEAAARYDRALRSTLNPDDPDTPLGRWQHELSRALREGLDGLRRDLQAVSEAVAVDKVRSETEARGTAKGVQLEDAVHLVVAELACLQGDAAEPVGHETGAAGSKVGDIVVTVNPEDTGGREVRYALEVKNRGGMSLRRILGELDRVLVNRDAGAAVAVFADPSQAPVPVPFAPYGNRALVVLDDGEPSTPALRLATLWARWLVLRDAAFEVETLDVAAIEALLDRAHRALGRVSTIRRCHSRARKGLEEAQAEVATMVGEAEEAIDQLQRELRQA